MPATPPVSGPADVATPTLRHRVQRGLLWQILGRGGEQGVRLAANLVLARLLAPEQFGLLGMMVTGLAVADALAFVGTDQAVIAERSGNRPRFVASAWALSLLRGLMLSVVLLLLAAPLASWFGQPSATGLFMLVAVQPILSSLAHPGAYVLLRELHFGRWAAARLGATALGMACTVAMALSVRDVRALVIGQLLTTALVSLASFMVTPRRVRVAPWLHRRHARRLLRFSAGSVGTPIFIMGVTSLPVLLMGPLLGPAALGVYVMLRRLCDAGRQMMVQAVGTVMIPASARVAADPVRFRRTWTRTLRPASLIALGLAGPLAWVGGDLPTVLLGPDFRGPAGLFSWLVVAGSLTTVLAVVGPFFWGLARPSMDRTVQIVRLIVLLIIGVPLFGVLGVTGVAIATAASSAVAILVGVALIRRHADIPIRDSLGALAPGAALGAIAFIAGTGLDMALPLPGITRVCLAGGVVLLVVAGWLARSAARRVCIPSVAHVRPASGASA